MRLKTTTRAHRLLWGASDNDAYVKRENQDERASTWIRCLHNLSHLTLFLLFLTLTSR